VRLGPAKTEDILPHHLSDCPLLLIRAAAGDTAARPIAGVFWESPDIFVLPGVSPQDAPAIPTELGGIAEAHADNTIYAQVWNLGQAAITAALVEFYWFIPTLGLTEGAENLIGFTFVDLGVHLRQIVKCPSAWQPPFMNGGHECLVVRISQPTTDPLGLPPWDASQNRHIGQRNIHVITAAKAARKPTIGINVGPLFGESVHVNVSRATRGSPNSRVIRGHLD
jgi:hypothetical protein